MENDVISIVIADDHDIYRDGLIHQFDSNKRYSIIDSCRDGEELMRSVTRKAPDIVMLDLKMPVMSGVEAIKQLSKEFPAVRCIVLSNFDSELLIEEALQAGAISYITKSMPRSELFDAIESTYRNIPYYCNLTAHKIRRVINANRTATGNSLTPNFTSSELTIIRLICQDMQVKGIAEEMLLGTRTIEKYRTSIYKKMNVQTTGGIAVYAIKHGLYHPDL